MNSRVASAFTLLELLIVLTITALVAGLVTLTLRTHVEQSAVSQAAAVAREADRQARDAARVAVGGVVSLSIRDNAVLIPYLDRKWRFPRGVQVQMVAEAGKPNQAKIAYASHGGSPSYVLHLACGQTSKWLCVLGFSGQCLLVDEELEWRGLFHE